MKSIELLAPARDLATAVDAVDCGADAIYIGASKFGARYAAGNSKDDIARAADYAHRFGARVYATLNTLLFDDELYEARKQAEEILAAGVDALIVQDTAYCRMGLDAEFHASTQMCNTSVERVKFLADCGFSRVILERALTLGEIRDICRATAAEIECFVHGAICVGHSGRCFLSRSTCERSGNRGACSQPCRLPYDLTDADRNIILKGKHLLSLRDMSLDRRLGDLLDAGVASFKIEGRLKDRVYVRNTVLRYRQALDAAMAEREGLARASSGVSRADFTPDLAKSFTRGGTEYYLDGKRAGTASFDTPKAVGEYLGRVVSVDRRSFVLDGMQPFVGDGLCFVTSRGTAGTNVNGVDGRRIIPNKTDGIVVGADVYRNFDRLFARAVENGRIRRSIPASAEVSIAASGIAATFTDADGMTAAVSVERDFPKADNSGRVAETVRVQTAKSGDTIFDIVEVRVQNPEGVFVPVSIVNDLRRRGLELLTAERLKRRRQPRIFRERCDVRCCSDTLAPQDNVTNRLSAEFWRDHGVMNIARGLDLEPSTVGERVMTTSYCLRREIGECLRESRRLKGDLYLEHGRNRYLLRFDCNRCEMSLIDKSKNR